MSRYTFGFRALIAPCIVGSVSCASVPEEAALLSEAVGERLIDVQASHEMFVQAYFQLSRERIEDFLQHRWIPEYMTRFVQNINLMRELANPDPFSAEDMRMLREELEKSLDLEGDALEQTIAAVKIGLGDIERGAILLDFANAAFTNIESQRRELLEPLDQLTAQSLVELRATYAQLIQMQDQVTAFIQSVHDVKAEQDEVLKQLGLLESKDRIVNEAVVLNDRVMQLTQSTQDAQVVVKRLKDLFENKKLP